MAVLRAILESTVADVQRISELLAQLDGIANAPLAAAQAELGAGEKREV